jgi:hypothetical protein
MLNHEEIGLYRKYSRDIDGWARVRTPQEHACMSDADWNRISELVQMLALVKSDKVFPDYARTIHAEILQAAESEDVLRAFDSIA